MTAVTTTVARPPLPESLRGAHVLVVGGSRGMGAAAVRLLVGLGAHVTAASRSGATPDGVPGPVATEAVDGADEEGLARVLATRRAWDHVLVTAAHLVAGPLAGTAYRVVEPTAAGWPRIAYEVARAAAPRLGTGGSITLTSSSGAVRPFPGLSGAAAAAAAVEGLTRALAVELAPLRVNAVRPGAMDTTLLRTGMGGADAAAVAAFGAGLPLGRVGRPEEAAAAALTLMANPYISGAVLPVDGAASLV